MASHLAHLYDDQCGGVVRLFVRIVLACTHPVVRTGMDGKLIGAGRGFFARVSANHAFRVQLRDGPTSKRSTQGHAQRQLQCLVGMGKWKKCWCQVAPGTNCATSSSKTDGNYEIGKDSEHYG